MAGHGRPFWGWLLAFGAVAAGCGGGLIAYYFAHTTTDTLGGLTDVSVTVRPSGAYLAAGLVAALLGQVLLAGGVVGLGVASAGLPRLLADLRAAGVTAEGSRPAPAGAPSRSVGAGRRVRPPDVEGFTEDD